MVQCSQAHPNPPGSRFCLQCGEKLAAAKGIWNGLVLDDRYQIRQPLGQGGFARTYLAADLNRFGELCVLKEFAPQVQGSAALRKAEELFAREAGVLYKLKHPQIPQFRELFRTADAEGQEHLFLVQDYIPGKNYRQLLDERRKVGQFFTEAELTHLFRQLLPVLHYIHEKGVIHRDISPENLILSNLKQHPVLIDFGGVKELELSVSRSLTPGSAPPTRLGKNGYAPDEQLKAGSVSPHSDLYALAATALVLLTGKEPHELLNGSRGPLWRSTLPTNSRLADVLAKMLEREPARRYQSAQAALCDLNGTAIAPSQVDELLISKRLFQKSAANQKSAAQKSAAQKSATQKSAATRPVSLPQPSPFLLTVSLSRTEWMRLAAIGVIGVIALTGWWQRDRWLPTLTGWLEFMPLSPFAADELNFSEAERQRKRSLYRRYTSLEVDYDFLVKITDSSFNRRYPELQGRRLTASPADAEWRERWDGIANEWLTIFERELTADARRKLGRYSRDDQREWRTAIDPLGLSMATLYRLTNARFFYLFPSLRGRSFRREPIGQVWMAIAQDAAESLRSGNLLQRLEANGTSVTGSLNPGRGQVYLVNLSQGQFFQLQLEAPPTATALSIFVPNPSNRLPHLLSNSEQTYWDGRVEQSGVYEIVVTSQSDRPFRYRLRLN